MVGGRDGTGGGDTKDEQCEFVVCEVENIHLHWREEEEEEEERLRINDVEDNLPCLRDL